MTEQDGKSLKLLAPSSFFFSPETDTISTWAVIGPQRGLLSIPTHISQAEEENAF